MDDGIFAGLVISALGILTGIIAIVGGIVIAIKKRNNELRIREGIIENKVDAETARALVTSEDQKTKSPYTTLRWGLALLGIGVGYFVAWALKFEDEGNLVMMAAGCGVGLLVSFFVSSNMEERKQNEQ